jgi:hypothetical protein
MIRLEDFDDERPFNNRGVFNRFKDTINSPEFKDNTRYWAKGSLAAAVLAVVSFTARFITELGTPKEIN